MDTNKDQPTTPGRDDFNEIANQLPLLIWWSDVNGHNFFNSAWRNYTGNSSDPDKYDYWTGNVWPYSLQQDPNGNTGPDQSREPVQRMYRLKRYDGEYRWVTELCVPRYTSDGNFAGLAGYCQDIDEMLGDVHFKRDLLKEEIDERDSLNEELAASNEELNATNEELGQTQRSLADLNKELENIIAVRTKALHESEQTAQALNEELVATNEELAAANEELNAANEELASTNEELVSTNEELTQSQEEILKRERLFKSIATNIPKSLVVVIGKDHRFLAVEGDLMAKMGLNSADYIGKHPSDVAPFERYEANKPLYNKVLSGKQFAIDRKGPAGEDYHIEFVPLRNDENEVYAALIISLDITDIRKAEERSAKLAAIVTSSDDAIVSKTLDGIVTSWNAAAERMFGFTEKEMMGQSILKIIPEERHGEEPRILERLRNGHRIDHFETERMAKGGRILDVSLTISPMRDSEGHIIGISKIARDISEKKRAEQKKNDFIAMVSHELKTPLTSLTAIVQLLQIKLKNDHDNPISGPLKNANRQVKKMANMINGFLNISRLDSGKMRIEKSDFSLNDLIEEAIDETKLVSGSGHSFQFEESEPVNVHADRDKVASVVLNLLSNAVKYSPKSTMISINCKLVNGKARVTVTDEGMGISHEDQKKLFDRYYRVENDETRHISGFGIGLYLSAEIVRQHGGEIWVESEPGKGSAFYFELPVD